MLRVDTRPHKKLYLLDPKREWLIRPRFGKPFKGLEDEYEHEDEDETSDERVKRELRFRILKVERATVPRRATS